MKTTSQKKYLTCRLQYQQIHTYLRFQHMQPLSDAHSITWQKSTQSSGDEWRWSPRFCFELKSHQEPNNQFVILRSLSQALFGSGGSVRDGTARVGLNMLTRAIANCLAIHASKRDSTEALPLVQAAASSSACHRTQDVLVNFMRAVYVVDGQGVLWFSHAEEVQTQMIVIDDEKRSSSRRGATNVIATVRQVTTEFQRSLQRAADSGVPIEECFSQFDTLGSG